MSDLPGELEPTARDDRYYGARLYAWIAALILTPLVSITGSGFSAYYASKEATQTTNVELVKLAIGVLEAPDSSEVLVEWALGALSMYTDVPISAERTRELSQTIRATTDVSIQDIHEHGLVGGENSEIREIGRVLSKKFGLSLSL